MPYIRVFGLCAGVNECAISPCCVLAHVPVSWRIMSLMIISTSVGSTSCTYGLRDHLRKGALMATAVRSCSGRPENALAAAAAASEAPAPVPGVTQPGEHLGGGTCR